MFLVSVVLCLLGAKRASTVWWLFLFRVLFVILLVSSQLLANKSSSPDDDLTDEYNDENADDDDVDVDVDDDDDDDDDVVNGDNDDNEYMDEPLELDFVETVTSSYDLDRLKQWLLLYYDKGSRPLANSSMPMKVYLRIKYIQINNLNEELQVQSAIRNEIIIYPNAHKY